MALVTPGVFSGGASRGAGAATSGMALKEQMGQNQAQRLQQMQEEMKKNWGETAKWINQAITDIETKKAGGAYDLNPEAYEKQISDYNNALNGLITASVEQATKAGMDPMVPVSILEQARTGTDVTATQQAEAMGSARTEVAKESAQAGVAPLRGAEFFQDENGDLVALTEQGEQIPLGKLKPKPTGGGKKTIQDLIVPILEKVKVKGAESITENEWDLLTLAKEDKSLDILISENIRKAIAKRPKTEGELPEGVTEADIEFTMKQHGLTREEVLERLK